MIGPAGEQLTRPVAIARTPVRVWHLPAVAGLPLLLGSAAPAGPSGPGQAPGFGVHPPAGYPPLAAPPGAPPPYVDDSADRRFERILWWLVALFLLIALLLTGANLLPGPVWAEMPADRALLSAERGRVIATVDGKTVALNKGDRLYVGERDSVRVQTSARGRLTFRGGAAALLCADSETQIGRLWTAALRPVAPSGELELVRGRILADTASTSGAFKPLNLRVGNSGMAVVNEGEAWYSVDPVAVSVSNGIVRVDGSEFSATGADLTCGDGEPVAPPAGTPSPTDSPLVPNPTPNSSPSLSPSPSASPTPSARATTDAPNNPNIPGGTGNPPPPGGGPGPGGPPPGPSPSQSHPPSAPPSDTPSSEPPPPNKPPAITWRNNSGGTIVATYKQAPCGEAGTTISYSAVVTDDNDPADKLQVRLVYSGAVSGSVPMNPDGDTFFGQIGPIAYEDNPNAQNGTITVEITAVDSAGQSSSLSGASIDFIQCSFAQ
jgi:putative peptide zinc metalloprotease protein